MASDVASASVNGNYAPHPVTVYGNSDKSYSLDRAGSDSSTNNYDAANSTDANSVRPENGAPAISKAEVGWFFVEQYYLTLSRSPEKLYLFYNKNSHFVSGAEAEKVSVCVGPKAIGNKIKELEFSDCKVRVTNVDAQGSDQNIVIQVIGEMSNKSAPHRKFAQTFVLAGQTNGYFVLNDIFRYIVEEGEDFDAPADAGEARGGNAFHEPAPKATEELKRETLTSSADPHAVETDARHVDEALNDVLQKQPAPEREGAPVAKTNGQVKAQGDKNAPAGASADKAKATSTKDELAATKSGPDATEGQPPAAASASEKVVPAEESGSATPAKSESTTSTTQQVPIISAAPRTWAKLAAAANRVATPNVAPAASSGAQAPQSSARSTSNEPNAPQTLVTTPAPPSQTSTEPPTPTRPDQAAGWQTAGYEYSKRQPRATPQSYPSDSPVIRAYIKNVAESLDADELKAHLAQFGELRYFDVSRAKSCAFVDFTNVAGYQAALAGNPHHISGHTIYVEERRPRLQYPYQRGGFQPGRGGPDGRPAGPGRGGGVGGGFNKDRGRGNFVPRGRGGPPNNMRGRQPGTDSPI